jgi:ferredoxin/flavodoxin---NADP+ reductase
MATVFVIGAGPAGLFAAQKIALAGHEVVVFNRDIKPGGLAEYGIYPLKDKMKFGLRKQFAKVFSLPNVHYFGHVSVGADSPVTLETLRQFHPAGMVFAVGAQGTKKLGMPGEEASGVYSAKDYVYHYNLLPPFATEDFSIGKRVAIVGMGNVMVDIARWLMLDCADAKPEEIVVVARRGPFEAKFDEKEFAHIHTHLDRKAFAEELERVKDRVTAVGQDIAKVAEATFPSLIKYPEQPPVSPRLTFRFLSSPVAIHASPDGRIARLTVANNMLVNRDGKLGAKSTGTTDDLDVDTLIFAIGDKHDPTVGLPFGDWGYATNPDAARACAPYEVFDPKTRTCWDGVFVVGWARNASEGLVGIARHDGETGATHVLEYLAGKQAPQSSSVREIAGFLKRNHVQFVPKSDLPFLYSAEESEAKARGLSWFKFSDDEEMLSAIERAKANSSELVSSAAE